MVAKVGPEDLDLIIKFGGGLHTRTGPDEVDPREATDGANFLLDIENRQLRNRLPFDLVGTVPNASEIRGGASLLKSDGTVSFLIQAGNTVYEWDGLTTFTSKGSVVSTAKLRGHWRSHTWPLDDKVLITDLNLVEEVLEWDGTTLATTNFTDEATNTFGNFYAKYVSVSNERAVFFHVREATTNRHMAVGSARGDYTQISVANRPSSSLSEADPFFLLMPDLKPINSAVEAFGTTIISTERGRLFNLTGSSAKDFALDEFYPGSAAAGEESLAYIGNDIIYGRPGRIESVRDTDRFGDSAADDLTTAVADQIAAYTGWRIIYNSRLNRVYMFPAGVSEVWVFQTEMLGQNTSPWMRWTTTHSLAFQPTFVMSMLDPVDGLEYVFMGDSSGNVYRLEGTGHSGDGGTSIIQVEWLTKLFSAPLDAQAFTVEGYIKYAKSESATVELIFEYAGQSVFSESLTIDIPAITGQPYYGDEIFYGDGSVYGTISGRLSRQAFAPPGQANDFQLRVKVSSVNDFQINEIGLRFRAASS